VLGLIVSRFLVRNYPEAGEGELTKRKSLIVSGEVLSQKADELGLGKHLLLGNSEIKTGGRKRPSILEDTFEALVGAIYLDGGLKKAEMFVHRHLLENTDDIFNDDEHKNYKSVLLEHTQAEMSLQPVYRVVSEEGPDHRKIYRMKVTIGNKEMGQGMGSSKKRAEQRAAKAALKKLGVNVERIE